MADFGRVLAALRQTTGCIGYHLCGAYLRNDSRKRGLRDASEKPDEAALNALTRANRETVEWMGRAK